MNFLLMALSSSGHGYPAVVKKVQDAIDKTNDLGVVFDEVVLGVEGGGGEVVVERVDRKTGETGDRCFNNRAIRFRH